MSDIRPAAHGAESEPSAAAVLTAAAAASTAYTAAAAKGAATALVRMFVDQGVFGVALHDPAPDVQAGPAPAPASVPEDAEAAGPTDWDRMCAAVAQAEARRATDNGAALPPLRLMGEAVARTAARKPALRAVPPAA
ncbi:MULTISPECIES: hypothetical protein [unclassified Streptomyces]|uniref:hypothetical protein n=1 Tax=unclassified Streptomyces TaxID=2593676 RepID=UPI002DDAB840|nr:hypothetical protein [Streptomyces sp. NBC_01237]WRZ78649.1 hypothetical protein OG251_44365 [Streptomyces sp. NBC_01237]